MKRYVNQIKILSKYPHHPLWNWINDESETYKKSCEVIEGCLKNLKSTPNYEKWEKNFISNPIKFWDYLSELYLANRIYKLAITFKKEVSFYPKTVKGKELDLLVRDGENIYFEFASMLSNKNMNILIEKIFKKAEENNLIIEIAICNYDIPSLSKYELVRVISESFIEELKMKKSVSYLDDRIRISLSRSAHSVAFSTESTSKCEGQVVLDIKNRINSESEHFEEDKINILILQMQHYSESAFMYFHSPMSGNLASAAIFR